MSREFAESRGAFTLKAAKEMKEKDLHPVLRVWFARTCFRLENPKP